jgi:hypothetical protein
MHVGACGEAKDPFIIIYRFHLQRILCSPFQASSSPLRVSAQFWIGKSRRSVPTF